MRRRPPWSASSSRCFWLTATRDSVCPRCSRAYPSQSSVRFSRSRAYQSRSRARRYRLRACRSRSSVRRLRSRVSRAPTTRCATRTCHPTTIRLPPNRAIHRFGWTSRTTSSNHRSQNCHSANRYSSNHYSWLGATSPPYVGTNLAGTLPVARLPMGRTRVDRSELVPAGASFRYCAGRSLLAGFKG